MRLTFTDQATAQARADKMHADMRASNALYAKSCADYGKPGLGGTARWAVPYQDTDATGKAIGTNWYIGVDQRPVAVMTALEIQSVPELAAVVAVTAIVG